MSAIKQALGEWTIADLEKPLAFARHRKNGREVPRLKAARADYGPNSDELVIAWKQAKARIQGK